MLRQAPMGLNIASYAAAKIKLFERLHMSMRVSSDEFFVSLSYVIYDKAFLFRLVVDLLVQNQYPLS